MCCQINFLLLSSIPILLPNTLFSFSLHLSVTEATFYLTPNQYIWRSIKMTLTKPVSPRTCLLFLDITNSGWGWSGHTLLCVIDEVLMSTLSHRVGRGSRLRFRETAHPCAIMMNGCLVCWVLRPCTIVSHHSPAGGTSWKEACRGDVNLLNTNSLPVMPSVCTEWCSGLIGLRSPTTQSA